MKQSSKCAIGGIVAALSLVLLISVAIVPFMTYALPAMAGILIAFTVNEIDKKWGLGVYAAVAILGIFLVPDKEVSVMYLALFGYYPVLKYFLEEKLKSKPLQMIIKILVFLVTMFTSYYLMIKLMGLEIDEMEEFGKWAVPMLLGMGLVAFIIYDIAISKMILLYNLKWKKHFHKFFK